jgi:SAM-dependent methyltransferase
MMDLSARVDLPELMDAADLEIHEYQRCLTDLAAVNRVTLTHRATLGFLQRATRERPRGTHISVLDLAFGQGDLLRAIARWAKTRGFIAQLSGIDLNPRSAESARAAALGEPTIDYRTGNVFGYEPTPKPEFIVTSQFVHHLPDDDIVRLLKWMDATAQIGWHVTDLHRHAVPYYGFRWLCRLMGWHRIVRYDGTVSIARSFRKADWERYLDSAALQARIAWHPMFRYGVAKIK